MSYSYSDSEADLQIKIERLEGVIASYALTERSVRNETIEECARVADLAEEMNYSHTDIAAAIRVLKDKP